jgi:hypothetical protein
MKHNHHFNDPDAIHWGKARGVFDDELGQRLHRCVKLGATKGWVNQLIHQRIVSAKGRIASGQTPPFEKPYFKENGLYLGEHSYGGSAFAPLGTLATGYLILARTGGGKTIFLKHAAPAIASHKLSFWGSDNYKEDLRGMLPAFRRLGLSLVILRAGAWKFNLLEDMVGDPRVHFALIVDLLPRCLGLGERARLVLTHGIHELYRKYNVWNGRTDAYPVLYELFEWIRTTPGLNEPARASLLDRLAALLTSMTPACAAYRKGWKGTDLAKHSIVFEMRSASEAQRQVLLETTLFSVFQSAIIHATPNCRPNLFVAFDDGQRLFTERPAGSGLTPMDELAGIVRGTGKGICILPQSSVGLSPRLIPNLSSKLFGVLGSPEDLHFAAANLGLTSEQVEWMRYGMRPGTFVAQLATADWNKPFVFRVPLPPRFDSVGEDDVIESLRPLAALPVVPAPEFARWDPFAPIEVTTPATPTSPRLSEVELRYLRAVLAQPGQPVTVYRKVAGVSGRRAVEIRERLTQAGLIRQHELATGQRGRHAIVLEPLEAAHAAIANMGGAA